MSEQWSATPKLYDPLKAGSIDGTDEEAHDKAVLRAMNAKYKPNTKVCGNPKSTLFVGRLNPSTTEDTLKRRFSCYGEIVKCKLIRDIVTGFSKCYAFIEFEDFAAARNAHREADKTGIDGNEILVEFECERIVPGWIPRRLGGGWGGNKKSGQLRFGGRDRPFRKPLVVNHDKRTSSDHWRIKYDDSKDYHKGSHYSSHKERRSNRDRSHR